MGSQRRWFLVIIFSMGTILPRPLLQPPPIFKMLLFLDMKWLILRLTVLLSLMPLAVRFHWRKNLLSRKAISLFLGFISIVAMWWSMRVPSSHPRVESWKSHA